MNWFFAIAFSHIEGHVLKQHWSIYLSNFGSGMEVCTMFPAAGCVVYCGQSCVTFVFSGINYREVFTYRGPARINLLL